MLQFFWDWVYDYDYFKSKGWGCSQNVSPLDSLLIWTPTCREMPHSTLHLPLQRPGNPKQLCLISISKVRLKSALLLLLRQSFNVKHITSKIFPLTWLNARLNASISSVGRPQKTGLLRSLIYFVYTVETSPLYQVFPSCYASWIYTLPMDWPNGIGIIS